MNFDRNTFLTSSDEELSAVCRITFTKGSGPGGQKRNKTSSAVKVELPHLGLFATDCTERSQFRNRANALKKLRMQIAINCRQEPQRPENMECSTSSPNYPLFTARLLDILHANNFDHRASAEFCGITPSALLKKIHRDPLLWQILQAARNRLALPVLHPPK